MDRGCDPILQEYSGSNMSIAIPSFRESAYNDSDNGGQEQLGIHIVVGMRSGGCWLCYHDYSFRQLHTLFLDCHRRRHRVGGALQIQHRLVLLLLIIIV